MRMPSPSILLLPSLTMRTATAASQEKLRPTFSRRRENRSTHGFLMPTELCHFAASANSMEVMTTAGLLNLNLTEVIPAVGLSSLDRQLDGWLPSARIEKPDAQTILSRFKAVRHIERGIKDGIAR